MDDRRQPLDSELCDIDRMPPMVLLARLPVPIWAVRDDAIVFANPAFEEMLGRPAASLNGVNAADLVDDELGGDTVGAVLRQRAGKVLGLRHTDGSTVKVIVSMPMLIRFDEAVVLVGVQDVTQHLWEGVREA